MIGGGATGAGVAWDCALRGYDTILVDRRDLAEGTSGRFHGLLHSGGRYVVKDPDAAVECVEENAIARRVAADAIEDTGGLFVTTPDDDPAYGDRFLAGCRTTRPAGRRDPGRRGAAARAAPEPRHPRAFTVPDAAVDVWKLVWALANGAAAHGARVLTYHRVVAIRREGDEVAGARLRNELSGEELDVEAGFTLNASGAWAAEVAAMAGVEGVHVAPGKGIMIAMNHRLVNTVVNRCTMPADGDILVPDPHRQRDRHDGHPLQARRRAAGHPGGGGPDARRRRAPGARLPRGARAARVGRRAPAVRGQEDGRHGLHARRQPLARAARPPRARRPRRFLTITGGKLTTYRLMAQDTVDAMVRQRGDDRPCRTAETRAARARRTGRNYEIGSRLRTRERHLQDEQSICECELVGRSRLEAAMRRRGTRNLDDIRRNLRLGMGPCQGGFCMYRAAGLLHGVGRLDGPQASGSLRHFLQERWKGMWPILYGDQLRQARLDDWIFQGLLDVDHLPADARGLPAPVDAELEPLATLA